MRKIQHYVLIRFVKLRAFMIELSKACPNETKW